MTIHRASIGALFALAAALAMLPAVARADEGERKIGQRYYDALMKRGQIVSGTPYNAALEPVAQRVAAAAADLYDEPFRISVIKGRRSTPTPSRAVSRSSTRG
jgi:hypothetical protein